MRPTLAESDQWASFETGALENEVRRYDYVGRLEYGEGDAMSEQVDLTPVDRVEVTVVMDNAIDILAAPSEKAFRPAWQWDWSEVDQLRAEHGYSLSVTVHRNGSTDRVLYDAGLTRDSTVHNMDVLGLDPRDYRAVVLSHGHADHHGGRRRAARIV